MLFAKDNGRGPRASLQEPVNFRLADSVLRACGVFLGVFFEDSVRIRTIEVGAMFPGISGHVIEAIGVCGEGFDGGGALEAIFTSVFVGEFSGEDVCEPLFPGFGFVPPDVIEAFFSTPGSEFPFGFGGEALVGPFAVGVGIFPSDANHRVVVFPFDVGSFSGGILPGSTHFEAPPLPLRAFALQLYCSRWTRKDEGAGLEGFGWSFGEVLVRPSTFSLGFVSGGFDEFAELGIGDLVCVKIESIDGDLVQRAFFGVERKFGVLFGATGVGGPLNPSHAFGRSVFGVCMKQRNKREEEKESFHEAWFLRRDT